MVGWKAIKVWYFIYSEAHILLSLFQSKILGLSNVTAPHLNILNLDQWNKNVILAVFHCSTEIFFDAGEHQKLTFHVPGGGSLIIAGCLVTSTTKFGAQQCFEIMLTLVSRGSPKSVSGTHPLAKQNVSQNVTLHLYTEWMLNPI